MTTHCILTESSMSTHTRKGREGKGIRKRKVGRKPASIVAVVDARLAPIAATGIHSPAPTMDDASGVIGGGR